MATSLTLENDSSLAQGYLKVNGSTAATLTTSGITANLTGNVTGSLTAGGSLKFATAQTASGTSVDFTGIPSWAKRITVMFSGVSTSGTSNIQIQLGTSATPTYAITGYASSVSYVFGNAQNSAASTSGLIVANNVLSADTRQGNVVLTLISSNTWTSMGLIGRGDALVNHSCGSSPNLASILTAVRITTVNGTDTFDSGTINISYEG